MARCFSRRNWKMGGLNPGWCWTAESVGHPYSPGWGGGFVVWTVALFLSVFRHGGGVALSPSWSISITEGASAGMLCHCLVNRKTPA